MRRDCQSQYDSRPARLGFDYRTYFYYHNCGTNLNDRNIRSKPNMNLDFQDLAVLIAITTATTTATTYVIIVKVCNGLKLDFCEKIEDLAIRLGVVEKLEGK